MHVAVCPGTFDPPTLGHLDVFRRASALFDRVVVAVGTNPAKRPLFDAAERIALIEGMVTGLPNVSVAELSGLLAQFAVEQGGEDDVVTLVKGVRGADDYAYEQPMAAMNRHLTGVDTAFLPSAPEFAHIASSLVKEAAALGGDVTGLLAPEVQAALLERLGER